MECSATFSVGRIYLDLLPNGKIKVFNKLEYKSPTKFELYLENNLITMTLEYENRAPEIHHAGANTNGTWFRFISAISVTINANEAGDLSFPEMSYIGDIHGVYTILDKTGNWILFNKTQVIWESGTTQTNEPSPFLRPTRDGNVGLEDWRDVPFWSTGTTSVFPQAELSKAELLVNSNGMWLIKAFIDGTIEKYKALEGTNQFALMPNEYELADI